MTALARIMRGFLAYKSRDQTAFLEKMRQTPPPGPDGQALMFACVDARLAPTLIAGTQREANVCFHPANPGNFIPPASANPNPSGASSELAALDFVLNALGKRHLFICGHANCKAVMALWGRRKETAASLAASAAKSPLSAFLDTAGRLSLAKMQKLLDSPSEPLSFCSETPSQAFQAYFQVPDGIEKNDEAAADLLSQVNVLQQCENVCSHSFLQPENLAIHPLWFDIGTGEMHYLDKAAPRPSFQAVDEALVERVLARH